MSERPPVKGVRCLCGKGIPLSPQSSKQHNFICPGCFCNLYYENGRPIAVDGNGKKHTLKEVTIKFLHEE